MELRFQTIIIPWITSQKTVDSIHKEKQDIGDKLWCELTKMKESHYSSFHTIYGKPDDMIQDVKRTVFQRIKNYVTTFDESQYEWKVLYKGHELQNNKTLNNYNIECGSCIYSHIYLFGVGMNRNDKVIHVKEIKSTIQHLLSQLSTNKKQEMFETYFVRNYDILSVLKRSLVNFMYYDNKDNFYFVYDILLLLFKNELTESMHQIYNTFYDIFNDRNINSLKLYLDLVSAVKTNKRSILTVESYKHYNIINRSLSVEICLRYKWIDGAFKDYEISPNLIELLLINGYKFIDYDKMETDGINSFIQYLQKNDNYIANKLNCYLYIIYRLNNQIKKDYCDVLQSYIHSKQSIQIIVNYVMYSNMDNINDAKIIQYIQNMDDEFMSQNVGYLNDEKWKLWKENNNFDTLSCSQNKKIAMTIMIKTTCDKTFRLNGIHSSTTIHDIKLQIEDKDGIPVKHQRLTLYTQTGTILNDTKTISYYNITPGDLLWVRGF